MINTMVSIDLLLYIRIKENEMKIDELAVDEFVIKKMKELNSEQKSQ